jgi:hypothetical protein
MTSAAAGVAELSSVVGLVGNLKVAAINGNKPKPRIERKRLFDRVSQRDARACRACSGA